MSDDRENAIFSCICIYNISEEKKSNAVSSTILDQDHFFDIMSQKDADRMANIVNPGQFSKDTLLFYANRNKAEPREVTKQVVWIILRNRIFHRTIRHIRSGFPSYARTLCALTLFAYALKNSFFPRTIPRWNSLPSSVVSSKTIEEFKGLI